MKYQHLQKRCNGKLTAQGYFFAITLSSIFLTGFMFSGGCGPSLPPYKAKPDTISEPIYCFDSVGHKAGSKPFIMGGTCCCTPTKELMDKYHADGLLMDVQLQDLINLYESAGIKTALDHQGCNNLCQWGPHILKGGKCMAPPTPGTFNFEEVRFAVRYVPEKKKK
jgi:hypothetical protein